MSYSSLFKKPNLDLTPETQKNMSWFDNFMKSQGQISSGSLGNFGNIFGKFLGGIPNIAMNVLQNYLNYKTNKENNETRIQLADEANALSREESEKAYQRSRPVNQVNEMRLAGMSEAGAINTLNGGGSYTPAPVNTAQTEAPQFDFTAAINAMQSAAQLAEQKRQFDATQRLEREKLAEQSRQFEATHSETKRLNDGTLKKLGIESELLAIDRDISNALKDGTIETAKLENVARQSQAILDKFKGDTITNIMRDMSSEEITNLLQLQAYVNMLNTAIEYNLPNQVVGAYNKVRDAVGVVFGKGKGVIKKMF